MLKIVLFYNQGARGWTETWYGDDIGGAPPLTLNPALDRIFASAIAFRNPLTTLEWVRFSVVGSPQKVNSFRVGGKYKAQPATGDTPDVVSTDAIWKLLTSSFARRTISLRGLNDGAVLRDPVNGSFKPSPALVKDVESYLDKVQGAPWKIRVTKNPTNTPGFPVGTVQTIRQWAADTTKTEVVLDAIPAGVVAGSKVRFYGSFDARIIPLFPRTPTVRQVNALVPSVVVDYTLTQTTPYSPDNLRMTRLEFTYDVIADYDFQALSSRDTGRPFGSSRGRRSAAGSRR